MKIFIDRNSSISSKLSIFSFFLLSEREIAIVNLRKQPCTSIPITRYLLDRYNRSLFALAIYHSNGEVHNRISFDLRVSIYFIYSSLVVSFFFDSEEGKNKKRNNRLFRFDRCSTFLRGEERKRKEIHIIVKTR